MPFETTDQTIQSVAQATNLLNTIRTLYQQGKSVQSLLALYQAGTNPAFNAAINAMFTPGERTELGAMLTDVNVLVLKWETANRAALGLTRT